MCKNKIIARATAPCGEVVGYCVNCTQYMDQLSCAYRCGLAGSCKSGIEDCLNCLNNTGD